MTRGVRHVGEKGEVRRTQGRSRVRLDEQVVSLLPLSA